MNRKAAWDQKPPQHDFYDVFRQTGQKVDDIFNVASLSMVVFLLFSPAPKGYYRDVIENQNINTLCTC